MAVLEVVIGGDCLLRSLSLHYTMSSGYVHSQRLLVSFRALQVRVGKKLSSAIRIFSESSEAYYDTNINVKNARIVN